MTSHSHPYDRLDPDLIIAAVESVGHWSDARLLALNSYENRVYQVGIEGSTPLIAKFYRPQRWSKEQILEEHRFSLELQEAEISVVAPIVDEQGVTLHTFEDFQFALFPRRGGYPPELDNLDNLLVLGRTLGRIHAVGRAGQFNARQAISVQRMLHESCELLLESFIPRALLPAYESLTADLGQIAETVYREVQP